MNNSFNSSRRRFLKVGVVGSAVLATAAAGVVVTQSSVICKECLWLQENDVALLKTIIPAMLDGALPTNAQERDLAIKEIINGFDISVSHFPSHIRDEIRQLLWLLTFPITRSLLAGVWSPWEKASQDDAANFLSSWQHARLDLLRVGYTALHDLILGAWYANSHSWKRIGYPGPPQIT